MGHFFRRLRGFRVPLISVFALLLFSFSPQAQDFPPDIAAITTKSKLTVAITEFDNPPFYSGADDKLAGIDITLAKSLGEALGVPVEFDRSSKTFNDVVNAVATGKADVAFSKISRTFARAKLVAFSKPYVELRHSLVFNRLKLAQKSNGRDIATVARSFDGTLGVIENSSFAAFARQRFPNAKLVQFKSWGDVVKAAIDGQIEAAYRDEFEIRKISVDEPDSSISLRTVAITDARDTISAVVPWNATRLLAIVDQVIDSLPEPYSADILIEQYRLMHKSEKAH